MLLKIKLRQNKSRFFVVFFTSRFQKCSPFPKDRVFKEFTVHHTGRDQTSRPSSLGEDAKHRSPPTLSLDLYISTRRSHSPGSNLFLVSAHERCVVVVVIVHTEHTVFSAQCVSVSAGLLFFRVQLHVVVSGWQHEGPMSHTVTDLNTFQGKISWRSYRNKS